MTRDPGRRRRFATLLACLTRLIFIGAGLVVSGGLAQAVVGTSIPESSSLNVSHSTVTFDLGAGLYPPVAFPAFYYPTEPDPVADPMSFTLFTNLEAWSVDVSFGGLYNELDNVILPVDRLEYSTDAGVHWHAFSLGGNTITQGLGRTAGLETFAFALRLRLEGDEAPGSYAGVLTFTLVSE